MSPNPKCYCVAWLNPKTMKIFEVGFYSEPTPTSIDPAGRRPIPLFSVSAKRYVVAEHAARKALHTQRWDWALRLVRHA